jgi:hypothetical protein
MKLEVTKAQADMIATALRLYGAECHEAARDRATKRREHWADVALRAMDLAEYVEQARKVAR